MFVHWWEVLCDMVNRDVSDLGWEQELWRKFIDCNDAHARDKLIQHYTPLAKSITSKVYRLRHDDDVAYEDYYQYALVGLLESIERFDPNANALFSTYAVFRIRGAIYNGIQKFSDKREQIALKVRLRKERQDSLMDESKQDDELDTFSSLVENAIGLALVYMLDDVSCVKTELDSSNEGPYQNCIKYELYKTLRSSIETLSERERIIISMHYFEFKTFVEISELLSLSKGRVSQLHKQAINTIKLFFRQTDRIDHTV